MPITGGQKYFDDNKARAADNVTILASSGDGSSVSAIDESTITRWRSTGSSDAVTETLTIDFPSPVTISRLFLLDFNGKEYNVKYDLAGAPTDFANVVGITTPAGPGIAETAYALDSAYYEFDSVTTSQIIISITKTQVVDDEKYLNKFICTTELGTLEGRPKIRGTEVSKNTKSTKMLSGKRLLEDSVGFYQSRIDFKTYPARLTSDIELMFRLYKRDKPFLQWLCGGKQGSDAFTFQMEPFRLQDVYRVKTDKSIKPNYTKNVFVGAVNFRMQFVEVVNPS